MACKVERKDNKIQRVVTDQGQDSELYSNITQGLFNGDMETSLNIFGHSQKEDVQTLYENITDEKFVYANTQEPRLYYKTEKGNVTESLEEIGIANEGGRIEVGVLDPTNETFIKFATVNTEATPLSSSIFSLLRQGLIQEDRVLVDGELRYKGKGYGNLSRAGARISKSDIQEVMPSVIKVYEDGTFTVRDESNVQGVVNSDGVEVKLSPEEIKEQLKSGKLKPLSKARAILQANPDWITKLVKLDGVNKTKTANEYKENLFNFMTKLGFSLETVENYRKNYETKHGKDIDTQGLLDLTNKVIALSENLTNEEIIEVFSEEVAHLAVEAMDGDGLIEGALLEVTNTETYNKHYANYVEVYLQQTGSLAQAERMARKEVLGKIIAEGVMKDNFQTPESRTLWTRFLDYIRSIVKPSHKVAINKLTKDVSEAIKTGNVEKFNAPLTKSGVYYSLKPQDGGISDLIKQGYKSIGALDKIAEGHMAVGSNLLNRKAILGTSKELNETRALEAITQMVSFNRIVTESLLSKANMNGDFSVYNGIQFQFLNEDFSDLMTHYKGFLEKGNFTSETNIKLAKAILLELNATHTKFQDVKSSLLPKINLTWNKQVEDMADEFGLVGKEREKLFEIANQQSKDVSWIARHLGLASEVSSLAVGMIAREATKMGQRAYTGFAVNHNSTINEITKKGYERKYKKSVIQKDKNGKDTFFLSHHLRQADFEADQLVKEASLVQELMGKDYKAGEALKSMKEGQSPAEILDDEKLQGDFDTAMESWREVNGGNRRMKTEFYTERQALQKKADIASDSKTSLANLRKSLNQLYNLPHLKVEVGGVTRIDTSLMTPAEKLREAQEIQKINSVLAVTNESGEFYDGLTKKSTEEITDEDIANLPEEMGEDKDFVAFLKEKKGNVIMLDGSRDRTSLDGQTRLVIDAANQSLLRQFNTRNDGNDLTFNNFKNRVIELENEYITNPDITQEQAAKNAFDFAVSNGAIRNSDAFYDSMSNGNGFVDQVNLALDQVPKDDARLEGRKAQFADYKDKVQLRSEILKSRRDARDSSQIVADNLSTAEVQKVLELDEEISELRRNLTVALNKYLPEGTTFSSTDTRIKMEVNESFERMRLASGKSILEFARDNMTGKNRDEVSSFAKYVGEIFRENPTGEANERFDNMILEMSERGIVNLDPSEKLETLEDIEIYNKNAIDDLVTEYAKDKVASYYKAYNLDSKAELVDMMERGEIKISDMLNEAKKSAREQSIPDLQFLDFTPDFTWSDMTDASMVNPYYNEEYGYNVPNFEKYKDTEFISKYGFTDDQVKNVKDIRELTPTNNKEEWDYLTTLYDFNSTISKNHNEVASIFLRVQQSSKVFEKVRTKAFEKGKLGAVVSDSLQDFTADRRDEKVYGEWMDGQNLNAQGIRIPPKYGRTRLEDPAMLTDNHTSAAAWATHESYMYKERLASIEYVENIVNKVESQSFRGSSIKKGRQLIVKKGKESNAYKMARDVTDHLFYGVKQNARMEFNIGGKTVDVTRMLTGFKNFSSNVNLVADPTIEIMSIITGRHNIFMERASGMYNSSWASKKASKATSAASANYVAQVGKNGVDSEVVLLLEQLGLVNMQERTDNSQYTRGERVVSKLPNFLAQYVNAPNMLNTMYANIFDTKVIEVNGEQRVISHHQYKPLMRSITPGITDSEIKSMWAQNDNHMKKFMDISIEKGVIQPNQAFKDLFGESAQEKFDGMMLNISAQTRQQVQRQEGIMNDVDRTFMHRNAFTNTLLQHRGWFITNLTRMFKAEHFNTSTGAVEEGSFRSLMALMGNIKENYSDLAKVQDYYQGLSDQKKANIKRSGITTASLLAILLLALTLKGSEDEDDVWAEQYSRYISYKWFNETKSNTAYGVYGNSKDIIANPVVMLTTFDKIRRTLGKAIDGEWKKAADGGLSLIPGIKGQGRITDPQKTANSFLHFNQETVWELQD